MADKYIRWHRHANAKFVHGHAEPVMPPHVCPWAVQAAFRGLLKAVQTRVCSLACCLKAGLLECYTCTCSSYSRWTVTEWHVDTIVTKSMTGSDPLPSALKPQHLATVLFTSQTPIHLLVAPPKSHPTEEAGTWCFCSTWPHNTKEHNFDRPTLIDTLNASKRAVATAAAGCAA